MTGEDEETTPAEPSQSAAESGMASPFDQRLGQARDNSLGISQAPIPQHPPLQIVQPSSVPVSDIQPDALNRTSNQCMLYKCRDSSCCGGTNALAVAGDPSNNWLGTRDQYQDMHSYNPSYMFNTTEVGNEYNLLNDFLNNSLLDDGALLEGSDMNSMYNDPLLLMRSGANNTGYSPGVQQNAGPSERRHGRVPSNSSSMPSDKAKEYYLQAADPAGNDTPEERMNRLLRAKYDAGMLKPFNYVKGYARLSSYMDDHLNATSKQKILRQLDRFRPKFREKVQSLTDIELIYVEMWFEQSLMEYDRTFASMAIPACCWRRTGEIFRGNKEMAELIHVPIEQLREVGLFLHCQTTLTHLISG